MLKEKAVDSLGQQSLLLPAWIKASLAANDRLKLYLTILQAASQHAAKPQASLPDWSHELAQSRMQDTKWLAELPKSAFYFDDHTLVFPQLRLLLESIATDIVVLARPICEGNSADKQQTTTRRDRWLERLREMANEEGLDRQSMTDLTHGNRKSADSLHLLVMDLHKQLNALSGEIATETLDGAHVWQIKQSDRPLIQAFMGGLHRTAPLKFSHPGLDTAVTRDGKRLLIQNDIGTNDVHVLVMEVQGNTISLTYSDLHAGRFDFFRQMLEEIGFVWTVHDPITTEGLNAGKPYWVGHARIEAEDTKQLLIDLESIASRIVFVIDWNRARKRLQMFVRKNVAQELLNQSAKDGWGHMGWLLAGAEHLVFEAMQAVDSEAFRVGDRLDDVLGQEATADFLLDLMRISSTMLLAGQPVSLIADEARLLLQRMLRRRTFEFDLLAEHAAYCHALAQTLCDVLEHGNRDEVDYAVRAKVWERQADHLVMEARQRAERQHKWLAVVDYLVKADDIADALEEAIFTFSLVGCAPGTDLPPEVNHILRQLADATLAAIQDQVKAVEIARHVVEEVDQSDNEPFLQVLWHLIRSERHCDELLRQARLRILQSLHDAPAALLLANELAATIENASDSLLSCGYALRQMVFTKSGLSS